jgi:hypothetical protein
VKIIGPVVYNGRQGARSNGFTAVLGRVKGKPGVCHRRVKRLYKKALFTGAKADLSTLHRQH